MLCKKMFLCCFSLQEGRKELMYTGLKFSPQPLPPAQICWPDMNLANCWNLLDELRSCSILATCVHHRMIGTGLMGRTGIECSGLKKEQQESHPPVSAYLVRHDSSRAKKKCCLPNIPGPPNQCFSALWWFHVWPTLCRGEGEGGVEL